MIKIIWEGRNEWQQTRVVSQQQKCHSKHVDYIYTYSSYYPRPATCDLRPHQSPTPSPALVIQCSEYGLVV